MSIFTYSGGFTIRPSLYVRDKEIMDKCNSITGLNMKRIHGADPYSLSKYFNIPLSHSVEIEFDDTFLKYPMVYKSDSEYHLNAPAAKMYIEHQQYLLDNLYNVYFDKFKTERSTISFFSDILDYNRDCQKNGTKPRIGFGIDAAIVFIYLCNSIGEADSLLYQKEVDFLLKYFEDSDIAIKRIQKMIDHFK